MKNNIKKIFTLSLCIVLVFSTSNFAYLKNNKGTEDLKAPVAEEGMINDGYHGGTENIKAPVGEGIDPLINDGVNGGTEQIIAPTSSVSDDGRLYYTQDALKENNKGGYNQLAFNEYSDKNPISLFGKVSSIGVSPSGEVNISTTEISDKEEEIITMPKANDGQVMVGIVGPTKNNTSYTDVEFDKNAISVSAKSAILVNTTNGKIYYGKDYDKTFLPAGLVNLMTAYIAVQNKSLDDVLIVNSSATTGIDKDASIAALVGGDTITVKDAIGALFVKGCVDCANVIAENVSGSKNEFVNLMNETAKEMGCKNTVFKNPTGLDDDNQVSTAYDMALIMDRITDNEEIVKLMSLSTYTLPKSKKRDALILYSKNTMLSKDSSNYNKDISCSRLGYTTKAEYNIASEFIYENNKFVIVVLNAKGTQFGDTKKLYEYAKKVTDEGK